MKNIVATELVRFIPISLDSATILSSSDCSLHPVRHPFGAANQAEILGVAERAEIADVEQMEKIVPFITGESPFGQHVCNLVFGVNVPVFNLGIQIDSVKQPIKRNSVGS